MLEERFTETIEMQPELVAHHYTEAGLITQAIPYWQQAGERATQRSAYVEAINHLTKGLELLKTLPDTPERTQQELTLQVSLGPVLMATKGWAAPEVGKAYARARELCRQRGEPPQLFSVLRGLWEFYQMQGEYQAARELADELLNLARNGQDPAFLLEAHSAQWQTLLPMGEFISAREHSEQGMVLYKSQQHHSHAFLYGGYDPGVACRIFAAWGLWILGYPDQALERSQEAAALAGGLSHPFSLAMALGSAALCHFLRREEQATQERAEATITLSTEQGFPFWLAYGTILRGWALAEQGQRKEGLRQIHQGMATWRATVSEAVRPYFLALLAEACGREGQAEEGLTALSEALKAVHKTGERREEAELYRLKGELTLQQFNVQGSKFKVEESLEFGVKTSLGQVQDKSQTGLEQVRTSQDQFEVPNTQHLTPSTQAEAEAEACFHKAIEIARKQQAKSLELRAVMSLVRLRQQQMQHTPRTTQHEACAMLDAARNTLFEIYNWFTEGFDTKDLQEAKALLQELSH